MHSMPWKTTSIKSALAMFCMFEKRVHKLTMALLHGLWIDHKRRVLDIIISGTRGMRRGNNNPILLTYTHTHVYIGALDGKWAHSTRQYYWQSQFMFVYVSGAHAKSVNRHNKTLNELKKAFYVWRFFSPASALFITWLGLHTFYVYF